MTPYSSSRLVAGGEQIGDGVSFPERWIRRGRVRPVRAVVEAVAVEWHPGIIAVVRRLLVATAAVT